MGVPVDPIVLSPNASTRRIIGYPIIATALVFAFVAGSLGPHRADEARQRQRSDVSS
jgi:hypothetical protein